MLHKLWGELNDCSISFEKEKKVILMGDIKMHGYVMNIFVARQESGV